MFVMLYEIICSLIVLAAGVSAYLAAKFDHADQSNVKKITGE